MSIEVNSRYWSEDIKKVRAFAKENNLVFVQGYDATADCDYCGAFTKDEVQRVFEWNAGSRSRGWISVEDDTLEESSYDRE